jgi:uncharacterized protein (TIGR02391 family)
MTLANLIPTVELLLAMPPEEVGLQLLRLAEEGLQNGQFSKGAVAGPDNLFGGTYAEHGAPVYQRMREDEVVLAVGEAWQWLENALLIIPHQGMNKHNSVLTRRAKAMLKDDTLFRSYCEAVEFPKSMLHPTIADEVWIQLAQGKRSTGVFIAFRAVEEAVRKAGKFSPQVIGTDLMHQAFHKDTGPLTKKTDPVAEREALKFLFSGAIGSYKNPHSHRSVEISDSGEAQEMVILASHLLRIVDSRKVPAAEN